MFPGSFFIVGLALLNTQLIKNLVLCLCRVKLRVFGVADIQNCWLCNSHHWRQQKLSPVVSSTTLSEDSQQCQKETTLATWTASTLFSIDWVEAPIPASWGSDPSWFSSVEKHHRLPSLPHRHVLLLLDYSLVQTAEVAHLPSRMGWLRGHVQEDMLNICDHDNNLLLAD